MAGGSGTRLYPLTIANSKQMLPVYDKPMIFYPISALMAAGIRDILVISTPSDIGNFERLLGDGSCFGVNFSYVVQPTPDGLAQAFVLGKDFIGDDACAMVLGDNIFFGEGFTDLLNNATADAEAGKATVFGMKVPDPERFGVVAFDSDGNVESIEEKPEHPKSNYCVTGLYFYPAGVSGEASSLKPSRRNELEITDLNNIYLRQGKMKVQLLGEDFEWWDTGTFDSLMEAAVYVQDLTHARGTTICSPEAIAYSRGWITREKLAERAELFHKTSYGRYLKHILEG